MPDPYSMKEAQANLTNLCRSGKRFVIANRNKRVVVAMPVEDFEALMETMDVPADPDAMAVIRSAKANETTHSPLNIDDENFASDQVASWLCAPWPRAGATSKGCREASKDSTGCGSAASESFSARSQARKSSSDMQMPGT